MNTLEQKIRALPCITGEPIDAVGALCCDARRHGHDQARLQAAAIGADGDKDVAELVEALSNLHRMCGAIEQGLYPSGFIAAREKAEEILKKHGG